MFLPAYFSMYKNLYDLPSQCTPSQNLLLLPCCLLDMSVCHIWVQVMWLLCASLVFTSPAVCELAAFVHRHV